MNDTYPIPEFLRRPVAEPRERPILFSAPMVRAILLGSKTQTRRVVKPSREFDPDWPFTSPGIARYTACPYGRPGDRLWVREGFSGPHYREAFPPSLWHELDEIHYWADGNPVDGDWTRPRPSIHMPRWASRILLEVVAVRVERLNEISEADAIAEGVFRKTGETPIGDTVETWDGRGEMIYVHPMAARTEYRMLWESINGENSWSMNPFVWVIEFRRLEARNAST